MDRSGGPTVRGGVKAWVSGTFAGSALRRLRREMQWRRGDADFRVARQSEAFAHVVARHATPLFRPLAGLDPQLQVNKVVNLRLAVACLDGVVLQPGVTLSFWHEVGKPSRRRGFIDGMELRGGRIVAGVGGGLCQMTNLLYWMVLHTPLTVTERWRHLYDVFPDTQRIQPFGSGATCAWPALDLQIENGTKTPYRLGVWLTETRLHGAWSAPEPLGLTYRIEEREHRIVHAGPGRYVRRNQLWRLTADESGACVSEELVAENAGLLMYEPFLPAAEPGA